MEEGVVIELKDHLRVLSLRESRHNSQKGVSLGNWGYNSQFGGIKDPS